MVTNCMYEYRLYVQNFFKNSKTAIFSEHIFLVGFVWHKKYKTVIRIFPSKVTPPSDCLQYAGYENPLLTRCEHAQAFANFFAHTIVTERFKKFGCDLTLRPRM